MKQFLFNGFYIIRYYVSESIVYKTFLPEENDCECVYVIHMQVFSKGQ